MDESNEAPRIEVQDIDHLGIVAGIIDEAGLVDEIDRRVGTHPQEHLSSGRAVKVITLNALGASSLVRDAPGHVRWHNESLILADDTHNTKKRTV